MRLETITGPMFCGKSEELQRRLRRAAYANKRIIIVKPKLDNRNSRNIFQFIKDDKKLAKYELLKMAAVSSDAEMEALVSSLDFDVLALDEAQFFGKWMLGVLNKILQRGCRLNSVIIASGLDMDAWCKPFGIMPELMAMSDDVLKLTAICLHCRGENGPAIFTQKKTSSKEQVEVGDGDTYEARCRMCHYIPE